MRLPRNAARARSAPPSALRPVIEQLECRLTPANPQAVTDAYSIDIDEVLNTAPAQGVLANDTAAGSAMQAKVFEGPAHGTLSLATDGSFTYTPDPGFVGVDEFYYHVTDTANGGFTLYTIDLDNDRLVAIDRETGALTDVGPIGYNMQYADMASHNGVIYVIDSGVLLSINPRTGQMIGSVALTTGATNTFTGADGLAVRNGQLYLTYTTTPTGSTFNLGTIDPQTGLITFLGGLGAFLDVDGLGANEAGTLYAVDTEGFSGPLKQIIFRQITLSPPGMVNIKDDVIDSNGAFLDLAFTPFGLYALDNQGFRLYRYNATTFVRETFFNLGAGAIGKMGIDWAAAGESIGKVTINVGPVNDEPSFDLAQPGVTVAENSGQYTQSDFVVNFNPGGGPDEAGQTIQSVLVDNDSAYLFTAQPAISPSGTLTFTPAPNASGTAIVTVRVVDSGGTDNGGDDTSQPKTFTLTITPVADAPSVTSATTNEDTQTTSGLVITRNAADGSEVTHFKITSITNGTLFLNNGTTPVNDGDFLTSAQANAGLKFTPSANFNGTGSFQVQGATDAAGAGLGAAATATVTVNPVNDAPAFTAGPNQAVPQDSGPRVVSGWAANFVPGPADESAQEVLEFVITGNTNTALFAVAPVVASDGTLSFTPAAGAFGSAVMTVRVRDTGGTDNGGQDLSTPRQFTITVTPPPVSPPPVPPAPPPPPPPAPAQPRVQLAVGTVAGVASFARLYSASGALLLGVEPFPGFQGGVTVASGDVNGDGTSDLIVGVGPGAPDGHVKVFDGLTGGLLASFFAFPGFQGGVNVAAGDIDGDGRADVIVGAGPGAPGGHVKVFSGTTGAEIRSFFAYGAGFLGGASVAAGDVDGDRRADVVTGSGAGAPSGHVKAFSGATGSELLSFFAYAGFNGGVRVSAGDTDGAGRAEIVTGTFGAAPHVKIFDAGGGERASFYAFDPASGAAVDVAAVDVNGDGRADVVATLGGGGINARVFRGPDFVEIGSPFLLGDILGGVEVG